MMGGIVVAQHGSRLLCRVLHISVMTVISLRWSRLTALPLAAPMCPLFDSVIFWLKKVSSLRDFGQICNPLCALKSKNQIQCLIEVFLGGELALDYARWINS